MHKWALAFLLLSLPLSAWAISGKGTTAATFFKIGVGPRAVGMGEAHAAVADDVSATYWNPAGLAQLETLEFTAMHVFWFQDISFDHLGAALPLGPGVAGASLVYLNSGTLKRSEEGDTVDSPDRGTFSASNVCFTGAYAFALDTSMSVGAGLKLFSESIDAQSNFGWAWDLSFLYRLPWPGLTLGTVVQNLGPATRLEDEYFRLPINFKIGLAYHPLPRLILAMDYNQLLEQNGKIGLGAEYVFNQILALRLGYGYQSAIDSNEYYQDWGANGISGLTAGLGIRYHDVRLDYAFVPYGFLGSTHRVGLTYALPKAGTPLPTPTATAAATAAVAAAVSSPVPTPPATPAPAQIQELETKIEDFSKRIAVGQLAKVQFASGRAELTSASLNSLKELARLLRQSSVTVRVEGHTDAQGVADENLKLSQRRVDTVKAYLVESEGLNSERLQAIGFGQTRPMASNRTKAGRRQNRRVEFRVVNQDYR